MFTWENLENAKSAYDKLVARVRALRDTGAEIDRSKLDEGRAAFASAMDNDLNTSLAVTALYDVFKLDTNDETKLALIRDFDRVLSLDLIKKSEEQSEETEISSELLEYINERIEARRAAKKERRFADADAIRDELSAKGITLVDTREGTTFKIN